MKKSSKRLLNEYIIDYDLKDRKIKIICQEKYTHYIKLKALDYETIVLIVPYRTTRKEVFDFISKLNNKIEKLLEERKDINEDEFYIFGEVYSKSDYSKKEIEEMYHKALIDISRMFYEIQKKYNFKKVELYFRKMRSRWGVCYPKQLKIGLSTYLSFVPKELGEYVILHEFCHLKYANHSKDFYQLLSIYCPNHRECRKQMKYYSKLL